MTQPWYPFFWKDYSGKTLHLTAQQHGVYFLCLRYIYTTGKPIPHKDRYRVAQATLLAEQSDCDRVLTEFFERNGENWTNNKASQVITEANERHEGFVKSGKTGANLRWGNAKGGYSDPNSQSIASPIATTTTTTTKKEHIHIEGFDQFWKIYPNKVGKPYALKCWKTALEKSKVSEIMAGTERYIKTKPADRQWCNPSTFLNQERWNDQPAIVSGGRSNGNGHAKDKPARQLKNPSVYSPEWIEQQKAAGLWPPEGKPHD